MKLAICSRSDPTKMADSLTTTPKNRTKHITNLKFQQTKCGPSTDVSVLFLSLQC